MRGGGAKGFYTLSSKASADQRVLVVLFNGYITFLPMKYQAWVPCRQSIPHIFFSELSDFRHNSINLCLCLCIVVNQCSMTGVRGQ